MATAGGSAAGQGCLHQREGQWWQYKALREEEEEE